MKRQILVATERGEAVDHIIPGGCFAVDLPELKVVVSVLWMTEVFEVNWVVDRVHWE
jgi:hypothetical protein